MSEKKTLVIGDCHGHIDRLEALLKQEGIVEDCPDSGVTRINNDVEVVQLGDLGHFGTDTQARDRSIWTLAPTWVDIILWGNHDRAIIDDKHRFSGYAPPFPETLDAVKKTIKDGQLRLAHEAHGFLLTHAGLHAKYKYNKAPHQESAEIAAWFNAHESENSQNDDFLAIRDAISYTRGGRATAGGILWRDASESLYKPVRQVFGHSAKDKIRKYQTPAGYSFCIDVGTRFNGRLAAIWLPEEKIVEVKLNEDDETRKMREDTEKEQQRQHDFWYGPEERWRMLAGSY